MLKTSTIRKVEDSLAGGGELVLRLALGITFFAHGRHKITESNRIRNFLASALAFAFTGAGRFSIDHALGLASNSGAPGARSALSDQRRGCA